MKLTNSLTDTTIVHYSRKISNQNSPMSIIEIQFIVRNHKASRHTIIYKQTLSENTSIINTVQHILFHHHYSDIKTEQGHHK